MGSLVGEGYNWLGVFVGLVTCFITFYYSVVTGWCLKYFFASFGTMFSSELTAESYWTAFTTDSIQPVAFHAAALVIGCLIIYRGVVRGIERTNRVLIPLLFLLLIIAAIRAITLPGATKGLSYLFSPNWSDLGNYQVWLAALTQAGLEHGRWLGSCDDLWRLSPKERHVHAHRLHDRVGQQFCIVARRHRRHLHRLCHPPRSAGADRSRRR